MTSLSERWSRSSGTRRAVGVLTALLAIVVGGAVIARLVSADGATPADLVSVDRASATSFGNDEWLWSGPSLCQSQRSPGTSLLHVREAASETEQIPLLIVTALAATSARDLLAAGRDVLCRAAAYESGDGGHTWRLSAHVADGASIDSTAEAVVWRVPVNKDGTISRVLPSGALQSLEPRCPAPTWPSLVSARSGSEAWLMCQDDLALQRTLLHTADGGRSWDVPANELSNSGLDGVGVVTTLDLHVAPHGWLLKPSRRCPEGELRRTEDAGNRWTDLPCPRASIPVSNVLTIRFTDRDNGVLIGVRGSRAVLARSADGGGSWHLAGG